MDEEARKYDFLEGIRCILILVQDALTISARCELANRFLTFETKECGCLPVNEEMVLNEDG